MKNIPTIIDIPYQADPQPFFEKLRDLPGAIWLDSGKPRSLQGRFDILSANPLWQLETQQGVTTITSSTGDTLRSNKTPLLIAKDLLIEQGEISFEFAHIPFVGGLMGFFNYDFGRINNGLVPSKAPADFPEMKLGWYGWGLILNHQSRTAQLVFHPACPPSLQKEVQHRLATPALVESGYFSLSRHFSAALSKSEYLTALQRIQDYIHAGDCYQVNFAQAFVADFDGDPWYAYLALRKALPSPYGAFMQWHDDALLCCSPERFLKVSMGKAESKPIKGTIARGQSVRADEQNAITLMNSSKDRAENLMIVDLLRNDFGKSCVPGSIRVPKLFALESFANVHHLVSTITGTLNKQKHPLDLLQDCFPGGSITGAPKKRAMEIIDELEHQSRGLYCGSIGYISATGRMDTNIAIRTLQASKNTITCWGGGGIVADSDPQQEYAESLQKVRILMATLESM